MLTNPFYCSESNFKMKFYSIKNPHEIVWRSNFPRWADQLKNHIEELAGRTDWETARWIDLENTSRLTGHSSCQLLIGASYSLKKGTKRKLTLSIVSMETTAYSNGFLSHVSVTCSHKGCYKKLTFHIFSSLYLGSWASDLLNSCVYPPWWGGETLKKNFRALKLRFREF